MANACIKSISISYVDNGWANVRGMSVFEWVWAHVFVCVCAVIRYSIKMYKENVSNSSSSMNFFWMAKSATNMEYTLSESISSISWDIYVMNVLFYTLIYVFIYTEKNKFVCQEDTMPYKRIIVSNHWQCPIHFLQKICISCNNRCFILLADVWCIFSSVYRIST